MLAWSGLWRQNLPRCRLKRGLETAHLFFPPFVWAGGAEGAESDLALKGRNNFTFQWGRRNWVPTSRTADTGGPVTQAFGSEDLKRPH